jgi:hypothetical protein
MTGQQLIDSVTSPHVYIRIRDPKWANPDAYLRLSVMVIDGDTEIGAWAQLFDRRTQEVIGEPTPQQILTFNSVFNMKAFLEDEVDEYTGPRDTKDPYE